MTLGTPHLHLRAIGSTSDRARELAVAGAPHGTLVTTDHQVAGRGRQGRTWTTPPRLALTMSLVLREVTPLLPMAAGVAVADAVGAAAAIKWPNDILIDGRKVAGILAEARPREGWAILGIGINVALRPDDFPPELRDRAGTLGRAPDDVPAVLADVLAALERRLAQPADRLLRRLACARRPRRAARHLGGRARDGRRDRRGRAAASCGCRRAARPRSTPERSTLAVPSRMSVCRPPTATPSVEDALETYRRELTGYCYRMLGSGFEAEDAVQETFVRAWRTGALDAREALRAWLYRIAHNVCLDMLKGSQRRARPMDLGPSSTAATTLGPPLVEQTWIMPIHDSKVLPTDGDPAEMAAAKETIRLAFVAALQLLPPKQRAVLILREVLRWQASEVAELLGTSVASREQRAPARPRDDRRIGHRRGSTDPADRDGDEEQRDLLARYMEAFEEYDISKLAALLHDDALFSMPPFDLWLRGPEDVEQFMLTTGAGLPELAAHRDVGRTAHRRFGAYRPAEPGVHRPHAVVVLEVQDGKRVTEICNFLGEEPLQAVRAPARAARAA